MLVYCCESYPERAQPNARNLERWLMSTDPPKKQFVDTVTDVLRKFWHIANEHTLNYGFKEIGKRVAPAEFVFTGTSVPYLHVRTA